jgi:hypothetical protein
MLGTCRAMATSTRDCFLGRVGNKGGEDRGDDSGEEAASESEVGEAEPFFLDDELDDDLDFARAINLDDDLDLGGDRSKRLVGARYFNSLLLYHSLTAAVTSALSSFRQ